MISAFEDPTVPFYMCACVCVNVFFLCVCVNVFLCVCGCFAENLENPLLCNKAMAMDCVCTII